MTKEFDFHAISYGDTGRFSKIVLDYINKNEELRPFYKFDTTIDDIKKAIKSKEEAPVNRELLYTELKKQYNDVADAPKVDNNIELLRHDNTFSICTAHQPNLFTGHFYFIHKIMHIIRLSDDLNKELPDYHFVPIFFMGSEDADLDELNNFQFEGRKYTWSTNQTGAVGKMFVDKELVQLISTAEGRLSAEPFGDDIIRLLRNTFVEGTTIQQATFLFVHELFKQFGLIVFLPDSAAFKHEMKDVFEDDIFRNIPAQIVQKTSEAISEKYHAQAFARDINLFYMKDDIRERIIKAGDRYVVHQTDISFTEEELKEELEHHAERFSPNVILRGLFQETFLPDVAWIGGGGELAYWLQLKDLFDHYSVPYPMLILRNSLLIIEDKWEQLRKKLGLSIEDLFENEEILLQRLVKERSSVSLSLEKEKEEITTIFDRIVDRAGKIDTTLITHVKALEVKQLKKLERVEKKFVSAEKKKQSATSRQLHKLLNSLFPEGGLQERTDNFMLLYAEWGGQLFDEIYKASPTLTPAFTIITEK